MATEKIICDTDVMIDYLDNTRSRHTETVRILENLISLENVLLSAITKMELLVGRLNKNELAKINKKIELYHIALINDEITLKAMELIEKYNLSHGLEIPDALIASTAIVTKSKLFTYNIRDYRYIDRLILYSPVKA